MVQQPWQHGTDGFLRVVWKDGVTKLTQLTGDLRVGKLFAITLFALMHSGQRFFSDVLGDDKSEKMLYVFQQMLCYWAWLKRDTYWPPGEVFCLQSHRAGN